MVDSSNCFALIRGRVMRVSKLDGCGNVVPGPLNTAVSKGFVSIAFAAQTDEGTAISVTNAAGEVCVSDTPAPKFTGYSVTVEFCGINPDLFTLMTGQSKVMDAAGTVGIGFRMNSDIDADNTAFALEIWSNIPTAACTPGVGAQYGYVLIPFLKGGIIGDFTVANDAVNFTLSGANTKDGSAWGTGPYNVQPAVGGAPGPLTTAVDDHDHLIAFVTNVAPPSDVCGAIPLGVPATGAVAGIPGHFTPTYSYAPANLAGMTGVTASPSTAWTTGQYVTTRDGLLAHWNSTIWVIGAA